MDGIELARQSIVSAKSVIVAGHVNPDGDSIGSLLALGLGIEKLGKRVYMVSPDGVPKKFRTLPGADRIITDLKKAKPADLAIAVDCGSREMLGGAFGLFKKSERILEIDHHDFRRPFGNIGLVEPEAAAVGELIYILLKGLDIRITKEIAQNLLTSIVVETNSFKLPNVRAFTFEVCTNLIMMGVDFYELVETVFWSRTKESAILSGICMSRCKFIKNNRIVWSIIKKKDFDSVKGKDEDVDAVADDMRAIRDVKAVVLFREKDKGVLRVSIRSKNKINVGSVAEHYNGGGHFDVAGCNIQNNEKSIRSFLRQVEKLL